MNTRSVAELLGISTSTVQRWVKQLNLEMERNELGHFVFSEEDIELLKQVKTQLHEGILLQDITLAKNKRTGTVKNFHTETNVDELADKIHRIETSLNQKADSVVSYQLLQHRHEMEELQKQIALLNERISQMEVLLKKESEIAITDELNINKEKKSSRKKKNFFQMIFGS
ncbi:MerR family transcriptional regulator [Bacillus sp. V3B]|uniref:MerR family transcriptional regulator n=1 Tax=Bacillus sp. V3B TaxID=2804915 RepID=UPI00210E147C|nr:MerR family transcriptional regulator [Bacillus sp. V3B]MCQ6274918.1 MerR family transcriptional regulator [Bacillus sp. V3B]